MTRFAIRHWTALLLIIVIAGWAVFYLPTTPSYAIFKLKRAIDARDGNAAAAYVDFRTVVRNAGYEMVQSHSDSPSGSNADIIGQLFGKSAVDLFAGPMAGVLQQWAIEQVDDGAQEVQMPAAAIAGAIVLLHRDADSAYTRWTDRKGQVWEVRMQREGTVWKVVQVKNIRELLRKLRRREQKRLGVPGS